MIQRVVDLSAAGGVALALAAGGCTNASSMARPVVPVEEQFRSLFQIDVLKAPVVRAQLRDGSEHLVSTVYSGGFLYRIYLTPEGRLFTPADTETRAPYARRAVHGLRGCIRTGLVVLDGGRTNVAELLEAGLLEPAIARINRKYETLFRAASRYEDRFRFDVSYLVVPAERVRDPTDRGEIVALAGPGLDLYMAWDPDAADPRGGWADFGGDFVYLLASAPASGDLTERRRGETVLAGHLRSLFDHEALHALAGWEHSWSAWSPEFQGFDDLIAPPELLGLTDVDGDGVLEILDVHPYGIGAAPAGRLSETPGAPSEGESRTRTRLP
jgi:hypothetical protein